ncbi:MULTISPECIES: DUF5085 family protein [Bacillus]|jgi:effector-binding domain-containing protein|uniref:DUF5085 family protein n=3 Tax=Bacillus thuringiensis TaxID=1428 RepID=A0A9X7FI57_BACTU|nr:MULTISPECIES: DUF5085 family protein [Bacillus]AAT59706.1 hypothetical protein BT9727_1923 [[Bacillus thuringiensis] serovar konkukian str. 97-27]AJI32131.1 hypothetical protein BG06_427 [Bacillus thuringiensis]ARO65311.1 Uncharacterized protein B5E39_2961 [Bacillus cereus]ASI83100.1 hypothetical protein FORC48_2009 [Bacillus cereus]KIZ28921.1 hypothetical protein SK30_18325 [Bacillus cereus]
MKVQYKALSLLNLISITQIVKKDDWLLPAIALRNQVVHNDIYPIGPVLFTYSPLENEPEYGEYMYCVPVNGRVNMEEDSPYEYIDAILIEEALCVRFSDEDGDIEDAYRVLNEFAKQNHMKLDSSFYHVCLDVYGDMWLDIYAPIIEVGELVR